MTQEGLQMLGRAGMKVAIALALTCHVSLVACHLGWAAEGQSQPKPQPAASQPAATPLKIAYVNLAKVFDGYKRTQISDAALEQKGKQKEAELEGRMSELKKLRESLELLSDQAREAKARQIDEKTDELQRFRNATARDLRRERDQLARAILQEIQKAIEDYAKANGYALMLDQRSLLYAIQAHDVTDGVLKLLNDRYAASGKN